MKTKDFLLLESYIEEIQNRKDVKVNLNAINRLLERMFEEKFTCTIIKYDIMANNNFFGACVYPSKEVVDAMVNSILSEGSKVTEANKIWKSCKDWVIEIDGALLYDNHLKTSPEEVVAVILHEIGHTVYSNTIPQRLAKLIKLRLLKINYKSQQICKIPKVAKLFKIPVYGACQSKNFNYVSERAERDADRFVVKNGYGEELNSFITKLVSYGNNRLINRTDKDIDSDINAVVSWTVENIDSLEIRKTKLKQTLKTQSQVTRSEVLAKCYEEIRDQFVNDDTEKFESELMKESFFFERQCKRVVEESMKDFFDKGKVKKIKQVDIDILKVELQKVEKIDDKFYVLDEIYRLLNRIDVALRLIDEGKENLCPLSKNTYLNFQKQLFSLRDSVLALEIPEKQYGTFIKVPKGYEG